jgi:alkylated DNA repair dioxygenase AlkB
LKLIKLIRDEKMTTLPKGLDLFDKFISEEDEIDLIKFIESQEWNTVLKRRTQHYGYEYIYSYSGISQNKEIPQIPEIFMKLYEKIKNTGKISQIDPTKLQVIVNEYEPGQGIGAHTDDINKFGEWVCGVSLSSQCEMTFYNPYSHDRSDIILERCSLYIMQNESRYNYTHAIAKRKFDNTIPRKKRISITFRYIK